jgi:hypothetical protein
MELVMKLLLISRIKTLFFLKWHIKILTFLLLSLPKQTNRFLVSSRWKVPTLTTSKHLMSRIHSPKKTKTSFSLLESSSHSRPKSIFFSNSNKFNYQRKEDLPSARLSDNWKAKIWRNLRLPKDLQRELQQKARFCPTFNSKQNYLATLWKETTRWMSTLH